MLHWCHASSLYFKRAREEEKPVDFTKKKPPLTHLVAPRGGDATPSIWGGSHLSTFSTYKIEG